MYHPKIVEQVTKIIKTKNNFELKKILKENLEDAKSNEDLYKNNFYIFNSILYNDKVFKIAIKNNNIEAIEIICKNVMEDNIIGLFYKKNYLTCELFKYLLNRGYNIQSDIFCDFIDNKRNDFFKIIMNDYIFNNEFIVKLLLFRKNKITLSTQNFKEIISKQVKKIDVNKFNRKIFTKYIEDTALTLACKQDNITIVKSLIDLGANINDVNYDDNSPLILACFNENINMIKYLVSKGVDINKENYKTGNTPLSIVCNKGNITLVKYFRDMGADINRRNKDGNTPLMYACDIPYDSKDNINVIEYLIKKGADVNIRNKDGDSALIKAIENGQTYERNRSNINMDLIECLIKNGANVNVINKNGDSPLIKAIENGRIYERNISNLNMDLIECLIKNGANVNVINKDGDSPLIKAIKNGRTYERNRSNTNMDLIEYLIENGANVNVINNNNETPVTLACSDRDIDLLIYLNDYGANLNYYHAPLNNNPLYIAMVNEELLIINYLCNHNIQINLNSTDKYGNTLLLTACEKNNYSLAMYLIEKGADINKENELNGNTPLINICDYYYFERYDNYLLVNSLVKYGADINKENHRHWTPLSISYELRNEKVTQYLIKAGANIDKGSIYHYVTYSEFKKCYYHMKLNPYIFDNMYSEDLIKTLIEHGIDVNIEDNYGSTPFIMIFNSIRNDIKLIKRVIRLLIKKGADINKENKFGYTPLMFATIRNNIKALDLLIQFKADINKENKYNNTALIKACKFNKVSLPIIKYLIKKGADINKRNRENINAFMIACRKRNVNLIKFLIDKGADVNIQNKNNGRTPLFMICSRNNKNNESFRIIRYLVKNGADINHTNNNGDTPLIFACKNSRNKRIIKYLINQGAKINEVNNNGETALQVARKYAFEDKEIIKFLIKNGAKENPDIEQIEQIEQKEP